MKIGITGTHGIPNYYGGFEAFAENLSTRLHALGHEVWVYNPDTHPWKENHYRGIPLVRIPFNTTLGPFATLAYDRLCFKDIPRHHPDIILNCGTPGAFFIPAGSFPPVITLADGLEWKRGKWNPAGKKILLRAEKVAVHRSTAVVADHPVMKDYFKSRYNISPEYIPYGVDIPDNVIPKEKFIERLSTETLPALRGIQPHEYYLLIARMEPENHLRMIIEGVLASQTIAPLLVVGDLHTRYGKDLARRYKENHQIRFAGGIFSPSLLQALRCYTKGYFHGHSVGGTNPSLLEAMASHCLIAAHDNPFNRYILGEAGNYFSTPEEIRSLVDVWEKSPVEKQTYTKTYDQKLSYEYDWQKITKTYLQLFNQLLH